MKKSVALDFAMQFVVDHVIGPRVVEEVVTMIQDHKKEGYEWVSYLASPNACTTYFSDVYSDLINDDLDPVFNCPKIHSFLSELEASEWNQLSEVVGKYVHSELLDRTSID